MIRRIAAAIHKRVDPIGYAKSIGVVVGSGCRLINVTFSTEPYLVRIGNHVSATRTHFETHDGGVWVLRAQHPDIDIVRPISVGDNVYFGYGCIVLPGVSIGDNVIIGAGSIVSRDIPDNSVAVGVPARVIKTVDEYAEHAIRIGFSTKRLSASAKRTYYLTHYSSGGE